MNAHQSHYVGRCVGCGYKQGLEEAHASFRGTTMLVLVCGNCDADYWYGEWVKWWEYKQNKDSPKGAPYIRWQGQVLPNWLPST